MIFVASAATLAACARSSGAAARLSSTAGRFNMINRETGNRVRYEVVDADTGEEVPQEDRVRGYKSGDKYARARAWWWRETTPPSTTPATA